VRQGDAVPAIRYECGILSFRDAAAAPKFAAGE